MKDIKVIFMGTPEFSVPVLEALIDKYNVIMVVTQPDKEVGRHKEIKCSPVKEVALKNNIEVYQPENIKKDYDNLLKLDVDMIVTCAYGQIIPKAILDYPKYGCINVHASLLPKLRGGAPLHKAIIYGEKETGITIMYMDEKMDNGDIIKEEATPILDSDNVGTIHDKLSIMGSKLLMETLPSIFEGTNERIKQDESKVTFAYNVTREEEKIDFNKTAREVFNQIRGLYPFPTAFAVLNGEEVKILESVISESTSGSIGEITSANKEGITVRCLDKSIIIKKLKPFGKKEMNSIDYINGNKELVGKKFN